MRLVSSAENSSLDWRAQYRYIEDIHDGRGYTAGIIGFCSGTGDMLEVVQAYTRARRRNPLARFIPALQARQRQRLARRAGQAVRRAPGARREAPRVPPRAEPRARPRLLQPLRRAREARRAAVTRPVRLLRRRRRARLRRRCAACASGRSPAPRPRPRAGTRRAYLEAFLDERVVEMQQGGRPRGRLPHRDRAAPLPARGQPRPRAAAALGGLRRRLLDRALGREQRGARGHALRGSSP